MVSSFKTKKKQVMKARTAMSEQEFVLHTKIKEYRTRLDIKQSELAEMAGVRRETIVRLEKGLYNPSLKLAMDLAKIFGTTVEELFQFEE